MTDAIQVITTTGTKADAKKIAQALLDERLAACIQIIGPITSSYWWEDEIEEVAEAVAPLSEAVENFWEMGQPLTHFKTTIKPPLTEFPILKRLGQPNFLKDDLLKTLGPAYQAITQTALAMAFGEEVEKVEAESKEQS